MKRQTVDLKFKKNPNLPTLVGDTYTHTHIHKLVSSPFVYLGVLPISTSL